ncbi:MAG: DUF711 family protein [Oscillospiraceae bacterium]
MVNNKTTAVRIIPAKGKTVGDRISSAELLGSAPVMPLRSVPGGVRCRTTYPRLSTV